jgi:hypothetical protein
MPRRARRKVYFQPDQILLLVEHPADYQTEQVIEGLQGWPSIMKLIGNPVIDPEEGNLLTFRHGRAPADRELPPWRKPLPGKDAFSLVLVDMPERARNPQRLIKVIRELNQQIAELRANRAGSPILPKAASPNWLSIPSPNDASGGGPGARPLSTDTFTTTNADGATVVEIPYKFKIDQFPLVPCKESQQLVEVAILDTVPACHKLVKAYNDWPKHPLLRALLGPSGVYGCESPLTITYAEEWDIRLPTREELRVEGHDYVMSDHGLFIAGIVHNIAPCAKLHLIEVLNEYGVGSVFAIARALSKLNDLRQKKENGEPLYPLVVNLSLTVIMPLPGQRLKGEVGKDDIAEWDVFAPVFQKHRRKDLTQTELEALVSLSLALEWICTAVRGQNAIIIAAAGNDAKDNGSQAGGPRPEARFPAAFPTVVGVSALLKDQKSADYANQGDEPDGTGLAVFGGKRDANNQAVEEESVLGVFTADFPDETTPNSNGWAWWSGTSFAAPVVSGILARVISTGRTPDLALGDVRAAALIKTPLADGGDGILIVSQEK